MNHPSSASSSRSGAGRPAAKPAAARLWLVVAGTLLIAACLRAPLTAVGPLIGDIRADTGLSGGAAGLLTTLTLLIFAAVSPLAPKLARRIGIEPALLLSLFVSLAGIALRSASGVASLFAGTALIGMGIAVGNVLLPTLIKRDYAAKLGPMTGAYSVSMNLWAAIASGVSIPLAEGAGLGWQASLGCWSLLTLAALAAWLPAMRYRQRPSAAGTTGASGSSASRSSPGSAASRAAGSPGAPWRSGLAWQITLFMGLQSILFYVNVAWLPEILQDRGLSDANAGWMLFLMQIVSLPATFLMPIVAGRAASQRRYVALLAIMLLVGFLGLLLGGDALAILVASIVLIGIATGAAFSMAVMFFALRTSSASEAAELSGMAQSIGYLVAAAGPAAVGFVHDAAHSWTPPLAIMLAIVAVMFACGLGAGSARFVRFGSASGARRDDP